MRQRVKKRNWDGDEADDNGDHGGGSGGDDDDNYYLGRRPTKGIELVSLINKVRGE